MAADTITAIAAVAAVAVSALAFWHQRREARAQVRVTVATGFLAAGFQVSDPVLWVEAANNGTRPVTLSEPGIRLLAPGDPWIPLMFGGQSDTHFPHVLLPGRSCRAWWGFRALARGLKTEGFGGKVRLVAFYTDQTGKKHEAKSYRFLVDEWAVDHRCG